MIEYLVGDGRDVIAKLADGSVDLIASSPPFFALRSYLQDEHDDKHNEMGSELTPADYLDNLLECTALWARVLAPHGSIAISDRAHRRRAPTSNRGQLFAALAARHARSDHPCVAGLGAGRP